MESIAQPAAETSFEDFCAALAEVIAPCVEMVTRLAPIACKYAACVVDAIQQYFESLETSTDAICPTAIDSEMLGKPSGLSALEKLVGPLMSEARSRCGKRLPPGEYRLIAKRIDEAGFRPIRHFEGEARSRLAENNRNARRASIPFVQLWSRRGTFGQPLSDASAGRTTNGAVPIPCPAHERGQVSSGAAFSN